ncbi:STAS domain-containing protein [Streptantibioticus parmotrematis]|uniref:STAS domain-containing protein n=1 Tax=Streptantibioticus parmotrematis TaxID=2873249 RepID=UPI0033F78AFE
MSGELDVVSGGIADGRFVVRVVGEIDADCCEAFGTALDQALTADADRTVVDVSRTEFADSMFLHLLLDAQRRHRQAGRRLLIAGPFTPVVQRLLEVTGTDSFFTLAPSIGEA